MLEEIKWSVSKKSYGRSEILEWRIFQGWEQ